MSSLLFKEKKEKITLNTTFKGDCIVESLISIFEGKEILYRNDV